MSEFGKEHIVLGLILLVVSLVGMFVLIPNGVDSPGEVEFRALSPSFWPSIVIAVVGLCGATIFVQGFLRRNESAEQAEALADDDEDEVQNVIWNKYIITIIVLFAFYYSIQYIGLPLAAMIVLPFFIIFGGERKVLNYLPIALILPTVLYLFFVYVASVPIPLGLFEAFR